ncbi:MAG: histidine phosphatase family protein [Anaerolineae bacterium]|nr:histidine phosphatase family protein [Anaerolineae bacterium]MCA9890760.1 histidine phosphatase family protein [Anaerolineae bacterium]MCA9892617.1 histidine phosphatase family protein [Anaerolineae bacterium]
MTLRRALFVRHGETDYNAERRIQGHLNVALNDRGHEQAKALAEHLTDLSIGSIYSSDLVRAYQTAEYIAERLSLPIITDERLREVNLGVFQGLTGDELRRSPHHADAYAMWRSDETYAPTGGESFQQLGDRTLASWQEISEASADDTVLIVTHGGNIRSLISRLFPMEERPHILNTSVTELHRNSDGWILRRYADLSHLES